MNETLVLKNPYEGTPSTLNLRWTSYFLLSVNLSNLTIHFPISLL